MEFKIAITNTIYRSDFTLSRKVKGTKRRQVNQYFMNITKRHHGIYNYSDDKFHHINRCQHPHVLNMLTSKINVRVTDYCSLL